MMSSDEEVVGFNSGERKREWASYVTERAGLTVVVLGSVGTRGNSK
jgi:hypothetical protein